MLICIRYDSGPGRSTPKTFNLALGLILSNRSEAERWGGTLVEDYPEVIPHGQAVLKEIVYL